MRSYILLNGEHNSNSAPSYECGVISPICAASDSTKTKDLPRFFRPAHSSGCLIFTSLNWDSWTPTKTTRESVGRGSCGWVCKDHIGIRPRDRQETCFNNHLCIYCSSYDVGFVPYQLWYMVCIIPVFVLVLYNSATLCISSSEGGGYPLSWLSTSV